jgi:hypothetical protein
MPSSDARQPRSVIEQDHVLPLAYDRVLPLVKRTVRETASVTPEALADGYFVATLSGGRKLTVRLGRNGADTHVSLRLDAGERRRHRMALVLGIVIPAQIVLVGLPGSVSPAVRAWIFVVLMVGCVAGAIGAHAGARRDLVESEVLLHRLRRGLEDAVEHAGVAAHYRVAPEGEIEDIAEEAASLTARR